MPSPADSLNEEHQAASSLLQILKQEQERLVEADIDGLVQLTEEKARLVTHMTDLAKRRHQTLAAAGFEASEAGMQAWLDASPNSTAARQAWKALLSLAESAKELNRLNGMLIGQHMARNQTALNVLQGAAQGGSFYGPDGQATTKPTSRGVIVG